MKPVPGNDSSRSVVKVHVDRFALFDIAWDPEVIRKLLAIRFSLAGIYTTEELLKLFFDLIFGTIPATRGAIFMVGRNPEQFEFMTYRDEPFEVDSGRAFALAVEPLKEEFAEHGLPQFTEAMNTAVESLEGAILGHAQAKAMHASVVLAFDEAMKEAMECLQSLDALVANTLSDNPQTMASWTVARTVIRAGGRKAKPPEPVPAAPAAA